MQSQTMEDRKHIKCLTIGHFTLTWKMLNHFEFVGSNTFQKSWDRETKPCKCKCKTQESGVKSQT